MLTRNQQPILLVEDDEVDVMMLQRVFRKQGILNPLRVAEAGDVALAMLRGEGQAPLHPMLILFDLNMPRMDGISFLKELRADPLLRPLPAVALTSSDQPYDRATAFEYHVAGFFVKPVDYNDLSEMFSTIARYWQFSMLPEPAR